MKNRILKRKLYLITQLGIFISLLLPSIAANQIPNNEINYIKSNTLIPDLVYFPTSHDFGEVLEGQIYETSFDIWNGGTGTLTWNLGIVETWIFPNPTSGDSDGPIDRDTVVVTIDTTGLSVGPHSGFVSISANDGGGMRFFNVECTVVSNDPPETPLQLLGPSSGTVDATLVYTSSAVDPDGDMIRYGIDFFDNDIVDEWTDYCPEGVTISFYITFHSQGTFPIRLKAQDVHGAESGWSPPKIVTISETTNNPPNIPSTPLGPSTGMIDTLYEFSTSSIDIDGDNLKYGWDWNGDDIIDEWSSLFSSGTSDIRSHAWSSEGTYNIQVQAEDQHGARSDFSAVKIVVISSNNPPIKPLKPSGPLHGKTGISYTYSTLSSDIDGDYLYYMFDWDDGSEQLWIGPFEEGEPISASHIWSSDGSYSIKVKVKDEVGAESVWSDPLEIAMPRTHRFHQLHWLINQIKDRFRIFSPTVQYHISQ